MKIFVKKMISISLVVIMLVGILPMATFAAGSVTNYDDFMEKLAYLEVYADEYASQIVGRDAGELVLNFIRTGVERYQDDNWETLAGREIEGFTEYVEDRDEESGTSVMDLRNIVIDNFTLPNGNPADFGHMFGCMNISYVAVGSSDLSGWAGDLCDLLYYCAREADIPDGTVNEMAAYINENCFGVDASNAFGWDDFYGDMDAYYIISEYKKGGKSFSEIMTAYFTQDLNDTDRTVYFMNNRFGVEDSNEAVRKAICESYSADIGIKVLESKRGIYNENDLRTACCYAFADYIYSQAKGKLVAGTDDGDVFDNDYYSIFSSEESILAPGITQKINYAQTVDGRQIVYYVATVDVTRDDVTIMANYKDNDPSKGWGYQRVMEQAMALSNNYKNKTDDDGNKLYENFNVIVATNADGYNMATAEPGGLLVMDGVEWHAVDSDGFFAMLEDGSAMIGTKADYDTYKDQIKDAVGGFGAVLIKGGKINVTKNANYVSTRASRTAIGIKEDGSVVMMVLDGRQLPFSAGGAIEEIAQIMLDAGCVEAINLDGGGSTTYLSKPAGSDELQLINRPSDGFARSVATSLVAISTAKPSNEFDRAVIESDYEYITSGTSMQFTVTGVSNTGNTAVIPEGSYWRVSDETLATIDNTGLFTAAYGEEGRLVGDVTVEFIVNGDVAGSKVVHLVIPDSIKFAEDRIVAIYDQPKEMDITVWYDGYPVAYTPLVDVAVAFPAFDDEGNMGLALESKAGVINGITFIGSDAEEIRNAQILGILILGEEDYVISYATVNLYYEDEATFDFDNADMGNRVLAWNRLPDAKKQEEDGILVNVKTLDNQLYRITDPNSPVEFHYTFALDMTAIDIPPQVEPLKSMLPTYQEGATAWTYLLQLAQRVCVLTNVTIRVEFSEYVDVDYSELKIVNDFFTIDTENITLDENNVLTLKCNWINQTEPVDAATANPLCILSGIKVTVKPDAEYPNNELLIVNNGYVTYDIYLAASSLYSFAQNASNQAEYGLIPYVHDDDCRGEINDSIGAQNDDIGAHFQYQYKDFADTYIINNEIRNAWQGNSYYVENEAVTGIQLIPCKEDTTKKYFYEFDKNGVLIGALSGLIEYNGGLYYAMNGQPQVRWVSLTDKEGNEQNYYFDPVTYRAADGEKVIYEGSGAGVPYTYTFENYILVKGAFAPRTDNGKSGIGYKWAGNWVSGKWFEVDGNSYYIQQYAYIVDTGFLYKSSSNQAVPENGYYLFDENGIFQKDYTGLWHVGASTYYVENGIAKERAPWRIVEVDNHFYFARGDASQKIVKNETKYVNSSFFPAGSYYFDESGKLATPLSTVTAIGEIDVNLEGRVLTVTHNKVCKVGYLDGDKYLAVEATKKGDSYEYALPVGAKAIVVVAGDVNGDGDLSNADKTRLNAAILGKMSLAAEQKFAADVNGDKDFSNADKTRLNAVVLGKTALAW